MKLVLKAFALCTASVLLGIFAVFVAAIGSGPTVAAGERAVEILALFDLVLAVAAAVLFWRAGRGLSHPARGLSIVAFGAVELFAMGALFLLSLLAFNR
jgi:hypothetical protein